MKVIKVNLEIYNNYEIKFCIGNVKEAVKYCNEEFKLPNKNICAYTERDFKDFNGLTLQVDDSYPIIWIPRIPRTAEEKGVLSHEVFHAVSSLFLDYVGMKLTTDSEEAYAYTIGFVIKEFWKNGSNKTNI
jgi:hypothetical protein